MDGKPFFHILSKLPSKSLLRFRCVSKLWREYIDDSHFVSIHDKQVVEDPTPIMFKYTCRAKTLDFHAIQSATITNHVFKATPVFEFVVKKSLYHTCYTIFLGSCNGLVLIKTDEHDDWCDEDEPTYTVIHPLMKQCYVLPQIPLFYNLVLHPKVESCGLGFDSSTSTFKMVCVVYGSYPSYRCTMVHVFGTNSWRKIPQLPSYCIYGKAIFAHGCLHWLADIGNSVGQVIWFDVKNEEFGLIQLPRTKSKPIKRKYNHPVMDQLVDLDGQVGYFGNRTTEVWVLNHKKEWVLHLDFEDCEFHDGYIQVLGCLNKAGDILIKVTTTCETGKELFYIYNLKNRVIHEARIDGLDLEATAMVMFPNSLCDIITNSKSIKKADEKDYYEEKDYEKKDYYEAEPEESEDEYG